MAVRLDEDVVIRPAGPADLDRVLLAHRAAFADEAVVTWAMPTTAADQERVTSLYRASLTAALHDDEVLLAQRRDGTVVGLSVWLVLPSAERVRREAAELAELAAREPDLGLRRAVTVMTLVADRHPDTPHLYLSAMAVLPDGRGRGVGGAMLRHRLARADAEAQPSYLEASTARSAALYARHGFRSHGAPVVLPDAGPRLLPMWREPGAGAT
ncbi:GNAT family N-acetyltransferase [Goodfellowiella coeruleoviolacea]|uniref:Ribosomal protein S18 acetylase RimI n=1 Tax=Goodfellowiella coeruleoviolacea TaxID=334858 RepID=A0AAE3G8L3_9PSEU|nr:GNAT family N-acetyltransferase [Goodfellowiella coeruleoviolacea]MCP2163278.1 Ribosomal protein S18 acetylase RimI [Goodfellowiella coeruleoviolacea]